MNRLLALIERICQKLDIELLPDTSDECWLYDNECIDTMCDCNND